MNDLTLIDFQIFPSQYEQDGNGAKCCWMGGRDTSDTTPITLQPYQTDAIKGNTNPEWAFHLLATGNADEYRLKYVKMSEPLEEWYGVSVDNNALVLRKYKEDTHFIVKKIGEYYTLEYQGKHVECTNGNLGKSTAIGLWDITPPTTQQVEDYKNIPQDTFRILWKFVKMSHISGPNWMTLLSTTRSQETIDRLFIPGTHDSGTEKNSQWYQTQFQTIPEQVAMGVRYLDLRVAKNWEIYHEKSYSGISLQYVVDTVLNHLDKHPDEFFFLQITPEDANGFSALLYDYLETKSPEVFNHVYMSSNIPTLEKAKGKIFFFARMYTPDSHSQKNHLFKEHPIDWPDNAPGSFATKIPFVSPQVYVQDRYSNEGDSSKFDNYIKPTLYNKMFSGKDPDWVINYTSVSNSEYPIHAAESINPWVANLLLWTKPKPSGVLMIDDARVGNIANIIALNFD
jgi:hypothetical protein